VEVVRFVVVFVVHVEGDVDRVVVAERLCG